MSGGVGCLMARLALSITNSVKVNLKLRLSLALSPLKNELRRKKFAGVQVKLVHPNSKTNSQIPSLQTKSASPI